MDESGSGPNGWGVNRDGSGGSDDPRQIPLAASPPSDGAGFVHRIGVTMLSQRGHLPAARSRIPSRTPHFGHGSVLISPPCDYP